MRARHLPAPARPATLCVEPTFKSGEPAPRPSRTTTSRHRRQHRLRNVLVAVVRGERRDLGAHRRMLRALSRIWRRGHRFRAVRRRRRRNDAARTRSINTSPTRTRRSNTSTTSCVTQRSFTGGWGGSRWRGGCTNSRTVGSFGATPAEGHIAWAPPPRHRGRTDRSDGCCHRLAEPNITGGRWSSMSVSPGDVWPAAAHCKRPRGELPICGQGGAVSMREKWVSDAGLRTWAQPLAKEQQ